MSITQVEHPTINSASFNPQNRKKGVEAIASSTISQDLQLAIQHQRGNRLTEAEQLYRQVLEKQPNQPDALHGLALLAQQKGEHQSAKEFIRAALQVEPESFKHWFILGNSHQALGEFNQAVDSYQQAVELRPEIAPIYNNLGYALQQLGKWEEAIASYKKAVEIQPDCVEADVNWGNALHAQGKLSPEQQAHYAQLNYKLGLERKKAGDLNNAILYYRQAIGLQPELWEAHYNLGIVMRKKEQLNEAIASYQKALELNPHNWEIYNSLAQIYQSQNNLTEAVSIYRKGLILLNPHYAQAVAANSSSIMQTPPPIPQGEVTVGAYQFPAIPPIADPEKPGPFWTVVIPVYNRTNYLLESLASVLVQWSGAENMEIIVVDNASTPSLFDLVNSIGGGIIHYYQHQQNIGAARNYNAGIALSRGKWVHVLHDDDCVFLGFYSRLQKSLENCPDSVGVACTGFEYFNEKGETITTGEILSFYTERGIMQDWLPRIGICGLVTVPAVVIRRTTHERLGGYHPELTEIAEWEIFKRYASFYDWWYEPGILARYREHTQKLTPQNWVSGQLAEVIRRAIEISETYLPVEQQAEITAKARRHNFNYCLKRAAIPLKAGNLTGALRVLQEAAKIDSSPQALAKLFAWLTQNDASPLREAIICEVFNL